MNFFWKWHTGGGTDPDGAAMSEIYQVIDTAWYSETWWRYFYGEWEDVRSNAEELYESNIFDTRYICFNDTVEDYGVTPGVNKK